MSEMIERVAAVLFDRALDSDGIQSGFGLSQRDALILAEAAIEAMIEPTQEMKNAALNAAMNDENIYKAMIAEALR